MGCLACRTRALASSLSLTCRTRAMASSLRISSVHVLKMWLISACPARREGGIIYTLYLVDQRLPREGREIRDRAKGVCSPILSERLAKRNQWLANHTTHWHKHTHTHSLFNTDPCEWQSTLERRGLLPVAQEPGPAGSLERLAAVLGALERLAAKGGCSQRTRGSVVD